MTAPVALGQLPDVPLVSVVIPCYNQAHFLAEAIESALAQTHQRVAIVVVDDGSTDATAAVAGRYVDVRYVRQENRGLAAARNRGLGESAGECLVFLDSDDRLHPRALEIGLRHLAWCRDAAFAYGRCSLVDAAGKPLPGFDRPIVEGDHYSHLLRGNFLPNPAAIVFRRDAIEAVGAFDLLAKGAEDYDLCLRLARQFGACGHEEVVADYRQHGASLSRKAGLMSESVLYVLRSQQSYVSTNPDYARAWNEGMRRWRRKYHADALVARARDNARDGHWGRVVRDTLSLLRANPWMLVENAGRKLKLTLSRSRREITRR